MNSNDSHLQAFDRFRIDLDKKVLWYKDEPVHLPPKAVELLCELVEHRGEIVTKDELLARVWCDSFVEENVLAQNIHYLRRAFKEFELKEDPIQTVPRRGYRFSGKLGGPDDNVVVEHEVVERELLAEISEDSLGYIDLRNHRSLREASRRSWLTQVLMLSLLLAAVSFTSAYLLYVRRPVEATTAITSVAILPLKPLGGPENDEVLSLGLVDSLISELGRLNKFAVRPFSSVERYRESGVDAIEFGRRLKVDAVIEGTIKQTNDRLRISLRLFDVGSGTQIWSDHFDDAESDILKLQDVIAHRVARALLIRLDGSEEEMLARSPTSNSDAYQFYLMGRESWLRRDLGADSIVFYRKALELDPNFALAWLGMADQQAFWSDGSFAENSLNKALELDPNLAEAHATRGFLQMFHRWDWPGAEASFRRALELAPNSVKAHHWYGVYLSLRGRLDEAMREMERALALDPTASVIKTDIAELYYFMRDYDRAETDLLNVVQTDPTFINARLHLVKVRYKKGSSYSLENADFDIFLHKTLVAANSESKQIVADLESLLEQKDDKKLNSYFLKAHQKNYPVIHGRLARYYLISGETEKSLTELERACEAREFLIPFVAIDPFWDPVRDHPRFKRIIEKIGLSA
jgi:TolB-like protein/DNA-binding winged helix-turn-helix (wHTH) protein/Tfp pilus assembly protein PilF